METKLTKYFEELWKMLEKGYFSQEFQKDFESLNKRFNVVGVEGGDVRSLVEQNFITTRINRDLAALVLRKMDPNMDEMIAFEILRDFFKANKQIDWY